MEVPVCMSSRELSSPQGRRVMGGRTGCLAACLTAPTPRPPRTVYGLPVSPGAIPSPGQRRQGRSRSPVCRLCLTGLTPAGLTFLAAPRETVGEDTASGCWDQVPGAACVQPRSSSLLAGGLPCVLG